MFREARAGWLPRSRLRCRSRQSLRFQPWERPIRHMQRCSTRPSPRECIPKQGETAAQATLGHKANLGQPTLWASSLVLESRVVSAPCAALVNDSFELLRRPGRPWTIPHARPEPPGPGLLTRATGRLAARPIAVRGHRSGAERRCLPGANLKGLERTLGAASRACSITVRPKLRT